MYSLELYDVIVIGAGLSAAVMAERFASNGKKVLILEKRSHIAGNCYDYIDDITGIRISKYGPHYFHTNDCGVWEHVNKFSEWIRYDAKIVAKVENRLVPVPVNMETINVLCGENLTNSKETSEWLKVNQIECISPNNSEEVALSLVGSSLYTKLFLGYTQKQWNRRPSELAPSVMARIPVRTDSDTRYFTDKYQGLPKDGYTSLVENMINHPNITVILNTDIQLPIKHSCVVYTGAIDSYFKNSGLPPLEYRSLRFEHNRFLGIGFKQQNVQINFPSSDVPYTRTVEYKHLPYTENLNNPNSVIVTEYPSDVGEPYYPVPNSKNQENYKEYQKLAENLKCQGIHMVGRLANYKYFNMDQAIRNALDYYDEHFAVRE